MSTTPVFDQTRPEAPPAARIIYNTATAATAAVHDVLLDNLEVSAQATDGVTGPRRAREKRRWNGLRWVGPATSTNTTWAIVATKRLQLQGVR